MFRDPSYAFAVRGIIWTLTPEHAKVCIVKPLRKGTQKEDKPHLVKTLQIATLHTKQPLNENNFCRYIEENKIAGVYLKVVLGKSFNAFALLQHQ